MEWFWFLNQNPAYWHRTKNWKAICSETNNEAYNFNFMVHEYLKQLIWSDSSIFLKFKRTALH